MVLGKEIAQENEKQVLKLLESNPRRTSHEQTLLQLDHLLIPPRCKFKKFYLIYWKAQQKPPLGKSQEKQNKFTFAKSTTNE